MMFVFKVVLIITAFLLALIGGLFYSYSCSVNLGLGRLTDTEYLRAMQSINRAILNPWFFASFLGTLIMMPVSSWMSFNIAGPTASFYMVLTATVIYVFATFGVTIFGNVPLNEALDKFDIGNATIHEIKTKRELFEAPWNRLNLIRAIANLIALILFIGAIVKKY